MSEKYIALSEIEEEEKLALMDYGNGNQDWLPVVIRQDKNGKDYILFCRDEELNTHAWHCNSLLCTALFSPCFENIINRYFTYIKCNKMIQYLILYIKIFVHILHFS
jgi:hypothetical protein